MLRRLWQKSLIAMARSEKIKSFMQNARTTSFLRNKYVAGQTSDSGAAHAKLLLDQFGIRSSLFFMGEYVEELEHIKTTVVQKQEAVDALKGHALDVHVSLDPTQIGHQLDPAILAGNAVLIGNKFRDLTKTETNLNCMMLDMEDATLVGPTIALHNKLQEDGIPVALTLQAYLRRTQDDMQSQIERGSRVRLVKGAFIAGGDIAYMKQADIKQNYYTLVDLMLSKAARETGHYPIIATHDTRIHQHAIKLARKNGWTPGSYEFEMLLGVREDVAKNLAQQGERVRLYVPFGQDWWPHAARRIGENPRNALLLLRSLVQ